MVAGKDIVIGRCYIYKGKRMGRLLNKKEVGPIHDRITLFNFEQGTVNSYESLDQNDYEECVDYMTLLPPRKTLGGRRRKSMTSRSKRNNNRKRNNRKKTHRV